MPLRCRLRRSERLRRSRWAASSGGMVMHRGRATAARRGSRRAGCCLYASSAGRSGVVVAAPAGARAADNALDLAQRLLADYVAHPPAGGRSDGRRADVGMAHRHLIAPLAMGRVECGTAVSSGGTACGALAMGHGGLAVVHCAVGHGRWRGREIEREKVIRCSSAKTSYAVEFNHVQGKSFILRVKWP